MGEVVGELISKPYIEIPTLATMARFGEVKREGWQAFVVPAGARYASPKPSMRSGDASPAPTFALGAIGGGPLRGLRGWAGFHPGRCACRRPALMGAQIRNGAQLDRILGLLRQALRH